MTMLTIQHDVGQWADATFPNSTRESILAHLVDEVAELTSSHDAEEIADCLLLLLHLCHKRGLNAEQIVREKLEKNRHRQWDTEPNERGYFHHVVREVSDGEN